MTKTEVSQEVSIANKYVALLRSQAARGYDYASRVTSLSKTWFLGLFLSGLMFFVFYISAYIISIWGKTEAANALSDASTAEITAMMKAIDPDLEKTNVTFDFHKGVLTSANFNDGVSGLWKNIYNYVASSNGSIPEPGAVHEYIMVQPNGVERVISKTKPMPPLTMRIDNVIGEQDCRLSEEEARVFLCERGVISNSRAKRALNTLRYCKREIDKPEGCSLWRQCTKRIIRDHFSKKIEGIVVSPSTVNIGKGLIANIPYDMCF